MKKLFTGILLSASTVLASAVTGAPAKALDCWIGFDPTDGQNGLECRTFDNSTDNARIVAGDKAWYWQGEEGDWGGTGALLDFREINGFHEVGIAFFHKENNEIVDGSNPFTGFDASLTYGIHIIEGSDTFSTVALASIGEPIGGNYTVTKTVDDVAVDDVVLSVVGSGVDGPEPIDGTTLTVIDEFDIGPDQLLFATVNEFTQDTGVPGPLPILGAGAAFGYSRRMRSRIRKATA